MSPFVNAYKPRVFQKKLHKVCQVLNFEQFVLGLRCLHQNAQQRLLLMIGKNIRLVDKYSLLIGWKWLHVSSDVTCI